MEDDACWMEDDVNGAVTGRRRMLYLQESRGWSSNRKCLSWLLALGRHVASEREGQPKASVETHAECEVRFFLFLRLFRLVACTQRL